MCRSIARVTTGCDCQWLSMSGRSSSTCRSSCATSCVTTRYCPGTSRSSSTRNAAARDACAYATTVSVPGPCDVMAVMFRPASALTSALLPTSLPPMIPTR